MPWPFKNKNRESKDDPKDKKLGQSGDHHQNLLNLWLSIILMFKSVYGGSEDHLREKELERQKLRNEELEFQKRKRWRGGTIFGIIFLLLSGTVRETS